MYTGLYGAYVKGTALVPVTADEVKLHEYSQKILDSIKNSRAGKKDAKEVVYAGVPVEFFAGMEATLDQAKAPSAATMASHLRSETGSSSAVPGPMQSEPILMATY